MPGQKMPDLDMCVPPMATALLPGEVRVAVFFAPYRKQIREVKLNYLFALAFLRDE